MSRTELHSDVANQIAALEIGRERPIVICDADEVIVDFMAGFEAYMHGEGLYFTWESYRLTGNIRRRHDGGALVQEEIRNLLEHFFAECIADLPPVAGAAAALNSVARRAQIVVLSNIPLDRLAARRDWLDRHGVGYPLVANIGVKGPAVRELAARAAAPACFIDDSPTHHASVASDAAEVFRLHFVANPRLAKLVDQAPDSHHRAWDWPAAQSAIETALTQRGF